MVTNNNRFVPSRPIHPGEILLDELKERNISQKELAKNIGIPASNLNAIIKGKRNLNEDLAIKLEETLGISYKIWMNLQNNFIYDSNVINKRKEEEVNAIKFENNLGQDINIKILYKILDINDFSAYRRVKTLLERFKNFDLNSVNSLFGFYKRSDKLKINEKNINTWLLLNWLKMSEYKIEQEYKKDSILDVAKQIAKLANTGCLTVPELKKVLNSIGIMYIELSKVEKAPIDAFSTIYNGHPCITVTYRRNDLDKLAFDILHELCHIDKHLSEEHSAFISIDDYDYSNDIKEKEANTFAKQMLISDDIWKKILGVQSNGISPNIIIRLIAKKSKEYNISPTIAIARYKYETGFYKTKEYISPKII